MDEPGGHYAKCSKPDTGENCTVSYVASKKVKLREAESSTVVTRSREVREMGGWWSKDAKWQFCRMDKCREAMHPTMTVLDSTVHDTGDSLRAGWRGWDWGLLGGLYVCRCTERNTEAVGLTVPPSSGDLPLQSLWHLICPPHCCSPTAFLTRCGSVQVPICGSIQVITWFTLKPAIEPCYKLNCVPQKDVPKS